MGKPFVTVCYGKVPIILKNLEQIVDRKLMFKINKSQVPHLI